MGVGWLMDDPKTAERMNGVRARLRELGGVFFFFSLLYCTYSENKIEIERFTFLVILLLLLLLIIELTHI
jgi:hypothetical protein